MEEQRSFGASQGLPVLWTGGHGEDVHGRMPRWRGWRGTGRQSWRISATKWVGSAGGQPRTNFPFATSIGAMHVFVDEADQALGRRESRTIPVSAGGSIR